MDGAQWHLLGPLQANKARKAVETFDVLQAVGSLALAERLDRIAAEVRPGSPLPVLLQVNVAGDPRNPVLTRRRWRRPCPGWRSCRTCTSTAS
ncbi:MAG: hypothetical protein U0838_10855 [Chloroflexota bacterium]